MGRPAEHLHLAESMPERIGPYRVHGQLGAGGVGVVYDAEDESLARDVAVKVLLDGSPANQARFRREARAMGRVNHPNVATVYDVGESDGQPYIAMELVRGQTLRAWLLEDKGSRRADVTAVLTVLLQAGAGLAAAHAVGLVHRDFKPDNVLVGNDGRVRVVDFGLAKHHAELDAEQDFDRDTLARELADARITRTGSLMGTPAYMAPEQFRGQGDARSDQFGFCVVLYEALHGRLPFPGETAEELYDAASRGRLRAWPEHGQVTPRLRDVLRRGLSARANGRFASMKALLDALARATASHEFSRESSHESEPRRRHHTKGPRSWRWKIVGAATGLVIAALSSALQSPRTEPASASASAHAAPVADTLARSPQDAESEPAQVACSPSDATVSHESPTGTRLAQC